MNGRIRELRGGRPPSDELSKELSLFMVRETGSRFGLIGGFPRNRVLANRDSAHLTRLANAVKRLGEYHREYSEGNQDPRLLELIDHYLRVLKNSRFPHLTQTIRLSNGLRTTPPKFFAESVKKLDKQNIALQVGIVRRSINNFSRSAELD